VLTAHLLECVIAPLLLLLLLLQFMLNSFASILLFTLFNFCILCSILVNKYDGGNACFCVPDSETVNLLITRASCLLSDLFNVYVEYLYNIYATNNFMCDLHVE